MDTAGGRAEPGGARTPTTGKEFYNVVAVLYHALHGNETIGIYLEDAETAGNTRLTDFFREAQDMQRRLADRAREELSTLEGEGAGARGAATTIEGSPEATTPTTTEPGAPPEATATDVRDVRTEGPQTEGPATTGAEPTRSGAPGATPQPEDVPLRTEETAAPLGREGARQPEREREEDRGFLDRARDALLGEEEEPRRREGTDRPEERR